MPYHDPAPALTLSMRRPGALTDWRNWYIGAAMLLTQCGNVALMYFLPLMLRNALYGPDGVPVPPAAALRAGDERTHELVRLWAAPGTGPAMCGSRHTQRPKMKEESRTCALDVVLLGTKAGTVCDARVRGRGRRSRRRTSRCSRCRCTS